MWRVATASFPLLDWLSDITETNSAKHAFTCMEFFIELATYIQERFNGRDGSTAPVHLGVGYKVPFEAQRESFALEYDSTLRKDWAILGQELAIIRGASRKFVDYRRLIPTDHGRVRMDLISAMAGFLHVAARSEILGD